jgi:hypothetical protein
MRQPILHRVILLFILAAMAIAVAARFLLLPGYDAPNVAHAGGLVGGLEYTNSIAALDRNHGRGFRIFEIDFHRTSDGHWVCGHDWDAFDGLAPDLEGFEAWRSGLPFPPCTLEELGGWFDAHPEALLISDPKVDVVPINLHLHEILGDQLIAQAHRAEEVCELHANGVPRIYLTFYRQPLSIARLREQLGHPCSEVVEGLTLPLERALFGHAITAKLVLGLPVYLHTINSCPRHWLGRLLGADGIMTDVLEPGRCQLS